MTKKKSPQDTTPEDLAARVDQLERELQLLRGQLCSQPRHTLPDGWLLNQLNQLHLEHNSASIDFCLAQLGETLGLLDVSLWEWQPSHKSALRASHWQAKSLPAFNSTEWIQPLLQADDELAYRIGNGRTQIFSPAETRELLGSSCHICLIPLQRHHLTEGLLVLLNDSPVDWPPETLASLRTLGTALYSVYERETRLKRLVDRDLRFQYAIEASRDGLWDWNIITGEIFFSRSYLRMLGYKHDSLPTNIHTLRHHFLHPEDAERVMTQYQAAIDNHRPYMNLEFRMLHRDGSELWIYSRAKFVELDAEGRPRRCVGVNANITDFVRAQEELLAAKTQADIANRTKGEFLARMSHEIRTPMNAIIGLGHLLQGTELNEQQKSYLGSMTTAAESLLHIINQVLDFSKIETGKIILENSHFDLDQVFEKLSRLFEISALHKAIDIVYDIGSDVPRFLRGDASRLSQIISHLITNALQYSDSQQVVVGVKNVKHNSQYITLEFTITDFGVGLEPEQLEQLQQVLNRSNNAEAMERSGYGLSICNHLVAMMSGRIHINSQPGQGCKISFTARFEHSHLGARSLQEQPHALNNLRALIVDDNAIARNIIASTAHAIRLRADTTDSAANALLKVREADAQGKPYHLVLMDYKMPHIDGLQATAMIKQDPDLQQMPLVLLISSYHKDEIFKGDYKASLADGFLNKPVSESRLFDSIYQAIGADHPFYSLIHHPHSDSHEDDGLLQGLQVLVAEDNLVNQQVMQGILRKKGVVTTIANNGREAVEILQRGDKRFDLVLMDLEMPEMDGYQATQTLRTDARFAQLPIVAVTAQAIRGDREHCLAAGMDAYLTKPIMPDLLYRTLAQLLRAQLAEDKT